MRALLIDQSITMRDEHSLQLYLNELDSMELISAEEEVRLAEMIRAGDQAALERLVRANLRFVVSCAKKYQRLGLPLADLVAEGNLGLIKAAKLFDGTRGFKFISYAVWWIRQSMMAALNVHARMIRLPGNMVKATADIRRTADLLEQQLERLPTEQELREELYVANDGYAMEYAFGRTVSSLDEPVTAEGTQELWSMLSDDSLADPDALLMAQGRSSDIQRLLGILSERERKVILDLFGFTGDAPRTVDDIAVDLGLTRERVRQVKDNALCKLRIKAKNRGYRYG